MMTWCRWILLGLLLARPAGAGEVRLEVKPLADGVWVHTSRQEVAPWGLVPSNGLIVREGDHVVVIDTAWGAEASRGLLRWIERELKLPVRRLIVTHFHDDRLGGWEVFAEQGARIVMAEQTRTLAKLPRSPAFDLHSYAPGERIACGSLEIFYPGRAHAPDNLVVWLPEAKILVGGCAVRAAASGGLGNVADAVVADWAASIARVQAAYPAARVVLPGHGEAGGCELLAHTRVLAERAAARPQN